MEECSHNFGYLKKTIYFCRMLIRKYIIIGLLGFGLTSCGEYQKALKSTDSSVKYAEAEKQYKAKKYRKAVKLFEQIASEYSGKPQGERLYFLQADAYYQMKQYSLATYPFERLQKIYPRSAKAVEAAFLEAKSLYMQVPTYSVDQTYTYQALEKLQYFMDRYSDSDYAKEANELILNLLTQLQKKEFEIAKQYDLIRDYQAAMKSLDNFLANNPGSVFREDALYTRLHSAYEWAINSVESKQKERLDTAKEAYDTLLRAFPETKYKKEADNMLKKINTSLKSFTSQK